MLFDNAPSSLNQSRERKVASKEEHGWTPSEKEGKLSRNEYPRSVKESLDDARAKSIARSVESQIRRSLAEERERDEDQRRREQAEHQQGREKKRKEREMELRTQMDRLREDLHLLRYHSLNQSQPQPMSIGHSTTTKPTSSSNLLAVPKFKGSMHRKGRSASTPTTRVTSAAAMRAAGPSISSRPSPDNAAIVPPATPPTISRPPIDIQKPPPPPPLILNGASPSVVTTERQLFPLPMQIPVSSVETEKTSLSNLPQNPEEGPITQDRFPTDLSTKEPKGQHRQILPALSLCHSSSSTVAASRRQLSTKAVEKGNRKAFFEQEIRDILEVQDSMIDLFRIRIVSVKDKIARRERRLSQRWDEIDEGQKKLLEKHLGPLEQILHHIHGTFVELENCKSVAPYYFADDLIPSVKV
ncbi:hypothetical protein BT69DRAFT_1276684 [Atractiella rhizophila]|nr:hypothetical protein BT69DRAFT_1276684 [Atractiella rhizophila]